MNNSLSIAINGKMLNVQRGITVAAAVAIAGIDASRRSVSGEVRGPLCGMGICFECRVTIDGEPHRVSCQVRVEEGMEISTQ